MSVPHYQFLDDDELIDLLLSEEDRLSREAAQEIVRRGDRMLPGLTRIISDYASWTNELPAWWAVVHASYLLGVIGSAGTVLPLLKALRYSTVLDCDWVFEDLPSIFGRIGRPAVGGLRMIVMDVTSDWLTRTIALESLAAITITEPDMEQDVFRFIGELFGDESEDLALRESAGRVLLDFLRHEYREDLYEFSRSHEQDTLQAAHATAAFTPEDVEQTFTKGEKSLRDYTKDWMFFYDEDEILRRQERWKKEARERFRQRLEDRGES